MPAALIPVLVWVLSSVATRLIAGLGIGYLTYDKVSEFHDLAKDYMMRGVGQLDSTLIAFLNLGGVLEAIEVIFGAFGFLIGWYSVVFTFKFVSGVK